MYELIIFLVLLSLGFGFGRWAETRHYRSILQREEWYADVLVFSLRTPPVLEVTPATQLVTGSVVISVDYFKQVLATLRMFFGGRLRSYESLLDRARREAILRMKESAKRKGASMVINVRLETASISKGQKDSVGSIEVLAYGTALVTKGVKKPHPAAAAP